MQVGQIAQHVFEVWHSFYKVTVIVFVIAHNENHMWESLTASFKERMELVATIVFAHGVVGITLCHVRTHTDVSAQDQHVSAAVVVKVQVTKFQVYVRYQCYFHFVSLIHRAVISVWPLLFDHRHKWPHPCQDTWHEIVHVFLSGLNLDTQNLL